MKAKVKLALSHKGKAILEVGSLISFSVTSDNRIKVENVAPLIPLEIFLKHVFLSNESKAAFIEKGLLPNPNEETKSKEETSPKEETKSKEETKPKEEAKPKAEAAKTDFVAAVKNLNKLFGGKIMGIYVTSITDDVVEGNITVVSTVVPPLSFSIKSNESGKLEKDLAEYAAENFDQIVNKAGILESLNAAIADRESALKESPKKEAAKPDAKKETPKKDAKKEATKKETPKKDASSTGDLFEESSDEDFEEPTDNEEFGEEEIDEALLE